MSIYKPNLLDKFKDFVNGLRSNWDIFESHQAESVTGPSGIHGLEYEEGSFTPTVLGGSVAGSCTYTKRIGHFIRINKMVLFSLCLEWKQHTGTGRLRISGLPFNAIGQYYSPISFTGDGLAFTGQVVARIAPNTDEIEFRGLNSDAAATTIQMDSKASIYLTGSYITN